MNSAYENLSRRFHEVALLTSSAGVLSWDQETNMPPDAAAFRAEQMAFLEGQAHRLATGTEIGDWLAECEQTGADSNSLADTNLRGWRRDYDLAVKLPATLVEEIAHTTSLAHHAWMSARKAADFSLFQPHLEKIVTLCQAKADAWGWTDERYDALLGAYEPGAKSVEIAQLFSVLGPQISGLLDSALERSQSVPKELLAGHYPIEQQQQFNREVAAAIGFNFEAGRIDTSAHPFCTELGPGDTRMTTRYDETDFLSSLYGVLHESGHGLYDQGLPRESWGLPAGQAASLGIHESQSRLWENHVGRSVSFWTRWLPRAAELWPWLAALTPEQMAAAAARVERSFIRVEADEVTYDLHIMLRFALERQVINGDISVAEIPEAWNALFEKSFGLQVPDVSQGCLQDVHWSFGGFGYFATYTLGNLNASQIMHQAHLAHPDLDHQLALGNYAPLLAFVRERIHRHGRRFLPQDLMYEATGERTQAQYHLDYLQEKYC
jgi:carboxypeptidase Taq